MKTYDSILSCLVNEDGRQKVKAQGFVKKMSKFDFLALTHYLADVLEPLNRLCLSLQRSNLSYADTINQIELTICNLSELQLHDGPVFVEFSKSLPFGWGGAKPVPNFDFKGHLINLNADLVKKFEKVKEKFITNLIENLSARFSPNDNVVKGLSVFDRRELYQENETYQLPENYGIESMDILFTHFSENNSNYKTDKHNHLITGTTVPLMFDNKTTLLSEWTGFKNLLISKKYSHLSHESFKREVILKYENMYPSVCKLYILNIYFHM
ncbi:hypothetical protein SNE40_013017 [Patella caerulea]|uniref:Uncharacterized protein n=1 Tax=Patella caerulea TaxID=87958 RepID=A0AAN8JIJ7_PATCE